MQQEPNTVHMRLYTPSGVPLNFVLSIRDGKLTEALPDVAAVEAMIAASGYLMTAPGVEAGEVVEPILYVCRYDHFDKKENRDVPHIAFYSESEWLTKRWLHTYLDKPEDVAAFEAATGLLVAKMPVWMGETHPERNNPKAQQFIVRLPKAIRIARDTYTNKEGEIRHKLKRYVDSIGNPQPAQAGTQTTASGSGNGNAGKQGEQGSGNNKAIDPTLIDYTKHMYENPFQHNASIDKLIKNGVLTTDMKPFVAACHVLKHRAMTDYMMDESEIKAALNDSLKDYLAQDGHNLITAWQLIMQHERQTKAS